MMNPDKLDTRISFDEKNVNFLNEMARKIRVDIVEMTYRAGMDRKTHPGPALSITDLVAVLFFDTMRIDPTDPKWPDRDRFILSKGHACPVLYSALAQKGFFEKEHLYKLRRVGAMLQGHPDMKGTPGVDMTTGSLGHGLSAGAGVALAGKIDKKDYRVFVIIGDGECQEGLNWEAAMTGAKYELDNLIAIIDCNNWQSCDSVPNTMPSLSPMVDKWNAFGWNTIQIDGHDIKQILSAFEIAAAHKGTPTAIIANTVKGKGVSFMEDDNSWHQKAVTDEQYEIAMKELSVS